jgi:hypothetical protein
VLHGPDSTDIAKCPPLLAERRIMDGSGISGSPSRSSSREEAAMCENQLWPDVATVVCRRADPHLPGASCRYVSEPPAEPAEVDEPDLSWFSGVALAV